MDINDFDYIQLKSNTKFIEIFKKKEEKCDITIPPTTI